MRIFKSRMIIQQLTEQELSGLVEDFRTYKTRRHLPDTFGRDELYDHPFTLPIIKSEEVRHIHLTDGDNPWKPGKLQYNKTSDSHLIYCQGCIDSNNFLLMGILAPDAHKLARDNSIMFKLGKMAETFRLRH
ncbi:type II toxin-antitoxin system mRNA interferase toxin YafO [Maricurvus nonylphenolicus]|uniref:type II toxin-antitoxin system YafO family toxin n=1 Tax=Maricurvus nonylphenolicus TaxID=1008307 RepID=UPI0036F2A539